MMKIIKKGLAFLLVVALNVNVLSLSTFAEKGGFDECRELNGIVNDNLDCYFEEAKKQIKSGASHVTVQNEKNIPNYRLEVFRYTALDEIIPNLHFEADAKKWNEIISNEYRNTFILMKKIGVGLGLVVGATVGPLYVKILSHMANKRNKNIAERSNKTVDTSKKLAVANKKSKRSNKWVYLVSAILGSSLFAFLGKTIVEGKISKFENQKVKELKIEKENALTAMESIKTFIENGIWKHNNCLCIQSYKDAEDGEVTVYFWDVDSHRTLDNNPLDSLYSGSEKKHFIQAFKKLKQELEKILKSNDYKK